LRRAVIIGAVVVVAAVVLFVPLMRVDEARTLAERARLMSVLPASYVRLVYPLEYSSEIGAGARRNGLNPALVAAVVYKESAFDAATTSPQGAVGLMQVLPSTAEEIARESGGKEYVLRDLQRPGVNVLYGSYYLRRLLDRYGGSELEAIAAYNAGQTNVDRWADAARQAGRPFDVRAIPYGETRDFVAEVERLRAIYDRVYGDRLAAR
jgi:soluble lytic murein transglycosylase